MQGGKFIRVENKINPFRGHSLPVSEDVGDQIASVHRVCLEHIM